MSRTRMTAPSPVRVATLAVSAVFLLAGAAGFIPWLVTDYDELRFAGRHSHALLLGVFEVSIVHNLVHLAFGAAGVLLGRTVRGATLFLVTGGVIYLLVWVYELWIDEDSVVERPARQRGRQMAAPRVRRRHDRARVEAGQTGQARAHPCMTPAHALTPRHARSPRTLCTVPSGFDPLGGRAIPGRSTGRRAGRREQLGHGGTSAADQGVATGEGLGDRPGSGVGFRRRTCWYS